MVSKKENQNKSSETISYDNSLVDPPLEPISRRKSFLFFAGLTGAAVILEKLFFPPAFGATWKKIGTTSGTNGTWQKINSGVGGANTTIGVSSVATARHSVILRSDGLVFSVVTIDMENLVTIQQSINRVLPKSFLCKTKVLKKYHVEIKKLNKAVSRNLKSSHLILCFLELSTSQ